MKALVDQLRSRGLSVTIHDGQIRVGPRALLTHEDRTVIQRNKAELLRLLSDPTAELDEIISAISREASWLTPEPKLLGAVQNLVNDCQQIWREGKPERALGLARHLAKSIPKYLREIAKRRSVDCAQRMGLIFSQRQ